MPFQAEVFLQLIANALSQVNYVDYQSQSEKSNCI